MSDNPMFLAVRRNLQPGFVAFKQEGSRLLYTLDNVTWQTAFDYSRFITQPNVSDGITPQQVLDILRIALKNSPNANPYNFFPADMKAVGLEIERGDCVAAGYVAELFVDFWNEASQAEYEGTFSDATGIIEGVLNDIFQAVLFAAGIAASGSIVGIPVGVALGGLSLVAPLAAEFYAGVSVGAFRAIYEALGGGATPPIHPLLVNEVKCALIEQLTAARTVANFQSISGALIPEAVADAWNAFATLEMWTLFNTISVTVDKSESFCCGESCFAVPPTAMLIGNASYSGVSWGSAEVIGQYLRSLRATGTGAEQIVASTFYPFTPVTGDLCMKVRVVVDAKVGGGSGTPSVRVQGIKLDGSTTNTINNYPWVGNTGSQNTLNGLNQYVFERYTGGGAILDNWIGIVVTAASTGVTATTSVFDSSYAILRAVEVCLQD